MRLSDWLHEGRQPRFGTIEQWIVEHLGHLGAEEEASYAIEDRMGRQTVVRILVAADRGLFDFRWHRPARRDARRLVGAHYLWREVRGVRLSGETRLHASLGHTGPVWALTIDEPAFSTSGGDSALREFWAACRSNMEGAR
jgi:hypothetical protein